MVFDTLSYIKRLTTQHKVAVSDMPEDVKEAIWDEIKSKAKFLGIDPEWDGLHVLGIPEYIEPKLSWEWEEWEKFSLEVSQTKWAYWRNVETKEQADLYLEKIGEVCLKHGMRRKDDENRG